ncbi:hypothetical protein R1flu_007302 [Riccia fluitans]|uniref:Uncharacterized protein n=1 Tax=Riccia fluitans TaxID=41844 RepID=A0ABD1YYF5_9MARC
MGGWCGADITSLANVKGYGNAASLKIQADSRPFEQKNMSHLSIWQWRDSSAPHLQESTDVVTGGWDMEIRSHLIPVPQRLEIMFS